MQCDASQNFQDIIEQQCQERQCASQNLLQFQGGFSVRSPKAKNMEDRLSPKAQDLVKKSAKVKSAFSDLVVEERKERKRALESKSRKKKVSLKAFVLILKPNNYVLHLLICMRWK